MRSLGCVLAGLAALLAAAESRAVAVPFTGTLSLQFATLAPIPITGGGVAVVNGSSGIGHLTRLEMPPGGAGGGAFSTSRDFPVTDPGAAPIGGIRLSGANDGGTFAGSGGSGSFGGMMPLAGFAKLCLFGPCGAAVLNVSVPLSEIGSGGTKFYPGFGMNDAAVTIVGAPWTTGTVSIGSLTAMGGAAPASNTGAPSGTLTLVTPIFISTNIAALAVVSALGVVELHFIPEPGTLVLLGSGIAALVALGRSSRNRK